MSRHHSHCGHQQHRRHCGCDSDPRKIVYPTRENVMHCCSEEVVKHVHPVHTTVVNHHHIRNEHVYPHSVSRVNSVNESNVHGQRPTRPSCGAGSRPGTGVGGAGTGGRPGYQDQYGGRPGYQGQYGGHKHDHCRPRRRPCCKRWW